MITQEMKEVIDKLTYEEMLFKWRFAPLGEDELFQGEVGIYFSQVMREKESKLEEGEKSRISKKIGWKV